MQQRGLPVFVAGGTAGRISMLPGADRVLCCRALKALLHHLASQQCCLVLHTWNDSLVPDSDGQAVLEAAGFYRDHRGMVWERPVGASAARR